MLRQARRRRVRQPEFKVRGRGVARHSTLWLVCVWDLGCKCEHLVSASCWKIRLAVVIQRVRLQLLRGVSFEAVLETLFPFCRCVSLEPLYE